MGLCMDADTTIAATLKAPRSALVSETDPWDCEQQSLVEA